MYAQGELNIAEITERAKAYVAQNDRAAFRPILRAIEQFAVSRKLIIGGRAGISALCKVPLGGADVWILELYSLNIEKDMTDCIAQVTAQMKATDSSKDAYTGDYRTIILRTSLPGREYRMFADYRLVAIGYSLGERKGINIADIIAPIIDEGPFGTKDAQLMPRDVQIMSVARALYNPANAGEWAAHYSRISALFVHNASGGASDPSDPNGTNGANDSNGARDFAHQGALVGEYAVEYYTGIPAGKRARPQYLISFDGIDDYAAREHLSAHYSDIRAPDDFRARKVTMHRANGDTVADLFNALAYEPIPVNEAKNIKWCSHIAAPFVVLRFLLLDVWALSFVIKLSRDNESLRRRQEYLRDLAYQLFTWIETATIAEVFPAKFMGIYVQESVAKRMVSRESREPVSAISKKELIALGNEILLRMKVI